MPCWRNTIQAHRSLHTFLAELTSECSFVQPQHDCSTARTQACGLESKLGVLSLVAFTIHDFIVIPTHLSNRELQYIYSTTPEQPAQLKKLWSKGKHFILISFESYIWIFKEQIFICSPFLIHTKMLLRMNKNLQSMQEGQKVHQHVHVA